MIIDSIKDGKVKSDPKIVIRNCSVIYLFLGKEMDWQDDTDGHGRFWLPCSISGWVKYQYVTKHQGTYPKNYPNLSSLWRCQEFSDQG